MGVVGQVEVQASPPPDQEPGFHKTFTRVTTYESILDSQRKASTLQALTKHYNLEHCTVQTL